MFVPDGEPYLWPFEDDAPEWKDDEYPDWVVATSRVISGPLGETARFPGTRHTTWQEAETYVRGKYTVIKFGVIPGRWLARIKK